MSRLLSLPATPVHAKPLRDSPPANFLYQELSSFVFSTLVTTARQYQRTTFSMNTASFSTCSFSIVAAFLGCFLDMSTTPAFALRTVSTLDLPP